MFSIIKESYNINTGNYEPAIWRYNYMGYQCLVEFPDGSIRNPNSRPIETK